MILIKNPMKNTLLLLFILSFLHPYNTNSQNVSAEKQRAYEYLQSKGEVYFSFNVFDKARINEISKIISIDNFKGETVFAYANKNEFDSFYCLNIPFKVLPHPGDVDFDLNMKSSPTEIMEWDSYPTYEAYVAMMNQFATDYPNLCRIVNAGSTVQGRQILFAVLNILTNNQKSYSAGVSWKALLDKKSYLSTRVSRNYTNYFFSKRDSNFNEVFKNESKESDIQLKLEYNNKIATGTLLSVGTAVKTIKLNYDIDKKADTVYYIDPNTGNNIVLPAITILDNSRTYKAFFYAEIIQNLMNRVKLTAGVRYDYFKLIYKKNYISPRTSMSITINPKFSVNLAYGIFYQSPSYLWIIGTPENKNLRDIRADHYIAGIEYLLDESTRLTIEGYYKDYKYYPVSVKRPYLILANNSGFEDQNTFGLEELSNTGTGNAKGFEVFLQKALTKNFYGTVSFSYSDVKYKAYDGIERRSDWDNRYVLNINGGYKLGKTWEFSAKFRIAGGRPYTPINPQNGSINYDNYNSEILPVYHRLDVRAEKKFIFTNWTLTTYIDIQNIYNKQNVFRYEWNSFKREIETDKNLGILPTIGISAEF